MEDRTDIEVRHDEDGQRFVATVDGAEAHLSYRPAGPDTLEYESTYVPDELRGRGVGQELVLAALDHARDQGLRVIPTCSFVARVVAHFPEYQEITLEGDGERAAG